VILTGTRIRCFNLCPPVRTRRQRASRW